MKAQVPPKGKKRAADFDDDEPDSKLTKEKRMKTSKKKATNFYDQVDTKNRRQADRKGAAPGGRAKREKRR
ncbi:hypothetical protein BT69DRAFT_419113 [Atractiella rhizophila]|nr:hypothetical protein BT69DRAFT_419113 [Atractiella rhizophila]